jgi:hypothetical protein
VQCQWQAAANVTHSARSLLLLLLPGVRTWAELLVFVWVAVDLGLWCDLRGVTVDKGGVGNLNRMCGRTCYDSGRLLFLNSEPVRGASPPTGLLVTAEPGLKLKLRL